jgi:mevalonate kinase
MTTASAPAKVILLGEHAAVYKKPVLTVALDRRAYVTVEKREDYETILDAPDLRIKRYALDLQRGENKSISFMAAIVKNVRDYIRDDSGIDIRIRSDIPIASGLGSSASISAAMVMAISRELGYTLSLKEIANLAWKCEHVVHSKSSGVDPFAVTFGGFCLYQDGRIEKMEVHRFPELIVAHSGVESDTGEVVSAVNTRKNAEPEVFEGILKLVERIVEEGRNSTEAEKWDRLGMLMNINHGLLSAIGVSSPELECLVHAARRAGAVGSKLSGAGCGGVMIALASPSKRQGVEKALRLKRGKIIRAGITGEGVRLENEKEG